MNYPLGTPVPDWKPANRPDGTDCKGRYVHLRRLTMDDAGPLFARFRCDDFEHDWDYMAFGPFADEVAFRDWMSTVADSEDPQFYAMVGNDNGLPFGFCSYLNIKPDGGSIEVGFIQVAPAFQRSTAFTEAMHLMAKRAFAMGYRRYEWKCDSLNERSRRAAHRLGFSYEGLFRQALVVKGRNRDTRWFSILDSEWPVLSPLYEAWLDPANFDEKGHQKQSLSALTAPYVSQRDPDLPPRNSPA